MKIIETLSKIRKTNAKIAVSLYVLVAAFVFLYGAQTTIVSSSLQPFLFVVGLILFTLIEYLTHRFVYHSGPDYKDEKNWQFKVHGVHHQFPNDIGLLALPIILALLLGALFFGLFYLIVGQWAFFLWPGFFLGYGSYLTVHYLVHSRKPPKNILGYLWRHHHLHHHVYEEKAFGVSSPLWDYIFGTMPPKGRIKRPPKAANQNS